MFKKVLIALALVVFAGGVYAVGKAIFPVVREKIGRPLNRVLYGEVKTNHPKERV
jgi:hypothetical protein